MNAELLALAHLNDPNYKLSEIRHEDSDSDSAEEKCVSFKILSDDGEIAGYIKAWHDEDDYAGFVHFDTEGNIVDWKTFTRAPGFIQSH